MLAVALAAVGCGGTAPAAGPAEAPSARPGTSAACDPATGQVVLFGGQAAAGVTGDTWTWSGGRWRPLQASGGPSARAFAAAAADGRGGVLLFGGDTPHGGAPPNDTWAWNGRRWTRLRPATVPPAGAYRVMALGPGAVPVLVVFGLDGGVSTWTWRLARGGDWVEERPALSPPWRDAAGLARDPVSGRVLLSGGVLAGGAAPARDTWAWDGAAWQPLAPAHRPGGGPAALATTRAGPLLLERDGTWSWRDGDWAPAAPGRAPAWQPYAALAGLPGGALLLTGVPGGPHPASSQTWLWDGSGWQRRA